MPIDERAYEKTWPGLPINHLILSTNDFIVFLDGDLFVDWSTKDEFDNLPKTDEERTAYNQVKTEIAWAESIPCNDIDSKIILNFKRQIGEALVMAFQRDYLNANEMIKKSQKYIIDRNIEQSRYMYLSASLLTASISILLGFFLWMFRSSFMDVMGETAFYSSLAFTTGSIGALLSVILRIGKIDINYSASKKLHYMEASSRIIAGMISGLLIGLCIKCGIFFSIVGKGQSINLAIVIGGLIAGASERLAPSIIIKMESVK